MRIRRAENGDIKDLVEVYLQGYKGLEEYSYTHSEDVQAYLNWLFRRDVAGIWGAEEDGKIVGFVASDGNWFSKREGKVVGAIHELVILPEYRNKVINKGSLVLWRIDQHLKAIGDYKGLFWMLVFYPKPSTPLGIEKAF